MTLKELAIDHDYYASDNNYYSNDATIRYEDWDDFHNEFGNADIDMNLVYRWDIKPILDDDENETGKYCMQVTIIGQRK